MDQHPMSMADALETFCRRGNPEKVKLEKGASGYWKISFAVGITNTEAFHVMKVIDEMEYASSPVSQLADTPSKVEF